MKTKAKSVRTYIVRLWSKKHYGYKTTKSTNVWAGYVEEAITKERFFFDDASELLNYIRVMYIQAEQK
jgi:hypothetical protein